MDWNYITPLQPLPNTPIFDKMVDDNLAGTEGFGDIKYFVGGGYAKIGDGKSNPLSTPAYTLIVSLIFPFLPAILSIFPP